MIPFWLIKSILLSPFLWRNKKRLIRPARIVWNPKLLPETVKVRGQNIFYVKKGEGKPLILIHGYGAGIWVWERQIEELSRFHRVFALDLIGHGFSDRPRIEYTPETYITFFRGFMRELGIENATLIGNSMGGGLAWAMAISYPKMVDRLILINSISPEVLYELRGDSLGVLKNFKYIPFISYLFIAIRNRDTIKKVLMDCISNEKLITKDVLERQYEISMLKGSTWVLYSTFKNAKLALDFKKDIQFIPHKTLLIWGEQDKILPVSVGERLHKIIPQSRFYLVPKTGHIPMWERPEEVNSVILDFLKES